MLQFTAYLCVFELNTYGYYQQYETEKWGGAYGGAKRDYEWFAKPLAKVYWAYVKYISSIDFF